jgi:hypothetical protein
VASGTAGGSVKDETEKGTTISPYRNGNESKLVLSVGVRDCCRLAR